VQNTNRQCFRRWLRLADSVTAKNSTHEKPSVCLSGAVNVSQQQQRKRESDAQENPVLLAWLVRRDTPAGKTQRGLRTQPAAMLRSV